MQIVNIPMNEIFHDSEFNCRGRISPVDVRELSKSLEAVGLKQPITVQPYDKKPPFKYRIVIGHRRHMAALQLGWSSMPCIVETNLTETAAMSLNLIENLERQDLNLMQEAHAISKFGDLTLEQIAQCIKKSPTWVKIRKDVLLLPEEIQKEVEAGVVKQGHIQLLIKNRHSKETQYEIVRELKDSVIKGEARVLLKAKPKQKKTETREPRNVTEIFKMQESIQEAIGNNLGTRALAWAAGEITSEDFWSDIRDEAKVRGIHCKPSYDL